MVLLTERGTFGKSRADLLLPLAHSSADNGQEMWLLLTAGQRPMGYPVSRQDQISSCVPFGGFGSTRFTRLLSGLIAEVHEHSALLPHEYVHSNGLSTGKVTLIGRNQSHQRSPVHCSGISLVCAQSHAVTCRPGQSRGLGRCGVFIQKAKLLGSLPSYLNRNTGLAAGKAI